MFADIDYFDTNYAKGGCLVSLVYGFLFVVTMVCLMKEQYIYAAIAFAGLFLFFIFNKVRLLFKKGGSLLHDTKKQENIKHTLDEIDHFLKDNPKWGARVYETPAEMRLLITHRLMNPNDEEVSLFFNKMNVDEVYSLMCKNQQCFRARVSPKPWRMDMSKHISPRSGTWPIKEEYMATRQKWLDEYEHKAKDYASCRFIQAMGNHDIDDKVYKVIELHYDLSKANSGLKIA
ncbi:hypothetical protein [Neisseria sp. Ec49-e6-T10]|uniref:hypothetical protein n=1 Tax=Neisseria sp. Ec49-e6-T10 TaxID=3140744 RepID=UPI003EC0A29E